MQSKRGELADDGIREAETYLECESCLARLDAAERASMRCGLLTRDVWRDGLRPYPEAEVCPGYTIRLPEVIETSRALLWAQRGELRLYFEPFELTPLARDCVDLLDSAVKSAERELLRESRERMKKS